MDQHSEIPSKYCKCTVRVTEEQLTEYKPLSYGIYFIGGPGFSEIERSINIGDILFLEKWTVEFWGSRILYHTSPMERYSPPIIKKKFCHLLILKLFQTHITLFLLNILIAIFQNNKNEWGLELSGSKNDKKSIKKCR